ncbi:CLUMA_CG006769, isoform A [Clunio marinus]|uniref:CLUMA_CG006769, isoform A n=1 Tax=Clunio marinus TaxID=568069 RepID=A0A1J1I4B5_9DIPT|nr:CLUMA_CG006769, isoform A [Clunio marinus]
MAANLIQFLFAISTNTTKNVILCAVFEITIRISFTTQSEHLELTCKKIASSDEFLVDRFYICQVQLKICFRVIGKLLFNINLKFIAWKTLDDSLTALSKTTNQQFNSSSITQTKSPRRHFCVKIH